MLPRRGLERNGAARSDPGPRSPPWLTPASAPWAAEGRERPFRAPRAVSPRPPVPQRFSHGRSVSPLGAPQLACVPSVSPLLSQDPLMSPL